MVRRFHKICTKKKNTILFICREFAKIQFYRLERVQIDHTLTKPRRKCRVVLLIKDLKFRTEVFAFFFIDFHTIWHNTVPQKISVCSMYLCVKLMACCLRLPQPRFNSLSLVLIFCIAIHLRVLLSWASHFSVARKCVTLLFSFALPPTNLPPTMQCACMYIILMRFLHICVCGLAWHAVPVVLLLLICWNLLCF